MGKKVKIIDVLKKISKGEIKEGTKILYENEKYLFARDDEDTFDLFLCTKEYESDKEIFNCTFFDFYHLSEINNYCEVIEPKE